MLSNNRFERARCKEQKHESGPVKFAVDGFCPMRDKSKIRLPAAGQNVKDSGTAGNVKKWNKKSTAYFKANYLADNLDRIIDPLDALRKKTATEFEGRPLNYWQYFPMRINP